jgi:predicted dehydrogenase
MTLAADFDPSEIRAHVNRDIQGSEGWQAPEGAVETLKATGPEPLRRELERFVDAVARRGRLPVEVEAGLLALRTVEASLRSSSSGGGSRSPSSAD